MKIRSVIIALILTFYIPFYMNNVEGSETYNDPPIVIESFIDESGCDYEQVSQNNVRLNWGFGNESILSGEQRADALGAEACTMWINGEQGGFVKNEISKMVDVSLEVESLFSTENNDLGSSEAPFNGLYMAAQIIPLEDLPESVNMRWYVTVDYSPLGRGVVQDLVKHYGWTSSFHHDELNITNWSHEISEERLEEDGIPFKEDELWRLEVVVLFIDDLNHTIYGVDSFQLQSPNDIPDKNVMIPTIIIAIAVIVGLIVIVRQDQQREVGLPRLRGTLHNDQRGWYADIVITAGTRDATLTGAYADEPWKIGKTPKQQLVVAGTSRNFTVKLRCNNVDCELVSTHWKIEVEELGGWILDLNLPVNR
tara:strand:+ start:2166 stop:3266 length:1101 start_codon:yes stop_codon:yes gene_type:complete